MRRDRGSASLELIGLIPVVGLVFLMLMQSAAAVYTLQATTDAARQAARGYSLGMDPQEAADAALPGALEVRSVSTYAPHGVILTVNVPRIVPIGPDSVTRRAVLP